uniref:Reverse transcriptase domain-containing protein n=1 Tax=Tanacetum cinerariifolium TaxID=118510 RepID=A0A6L2LBY2_TANCI|nr:hypothetical protein [Tanacetum cinerariifolium]
MQGRSGVKRMLFESCRNNMGNEPILALPRGTNDFVVMWEAKVETSKAKNASTEVLRSLNQRIEKRDGVSTKRDWRYKLSIKGLQVHCNDLRYLSESVEKKTMDFIPKLPRSSSRYDVIWVIVDRLAKSTDDPSERTFRTLENMFRACVRNLVVVGILTFREMSFPTKIVIIRVFNVFSLEALYGRKCRSSMLWAEIGKSCLIGPELVIKTTDKVVLIKEKLKQARDHQKSYEDKRRKSLEFEVGDRVLLKVSPWRSVCLADTILHVPLDEIKVDKILHSVKELVEIMKREIRKLKRKLTALVKVRWNSKRGPEFTWEHEDQKRIKGYCDNRGLSHLVILDDDLDHKIDIMVHEVLIDRNFTCS